MITTTPASAFSAKGGGFLLAATSPAAVFTPEDFSDLHKDIARTTSEFFAKEVAPNLDPVLHKDKAVALLRRSAELGLTGVAVPERFGGMGMDLPSALIVAENLARDGSYSVWHGAHTGIGTWPVLLFGTEAQKAKYLPKLASAELIAAYCLSEPQAGSDALASKTRADLSADGTHYVLSGQKMWISNGGYADLYTVFAKIGGELFSAFLVESPSPGIQPGAEERKMGLEGSSTTAVYFDNVSVPAGNLLGEPGKGHLIAFNILNIGRLKLGAGTIGAAKHVLQVSIAYAKERKAFSKAIAEFGLIQHKLAEMAVRIYAAESLVYRVAGLIEAQMDGISREDPDAAKHEMKAAEEFAVECSYAKVAGSEMLDYVTDEGVQIHGGYGYHRDYLVERAYRDSRINRIFEGTNEINRMLATGMLLKRAQRGRLGLVAAVKELQGEITSGVMPAPDPVVNSKKIALLCLGAAYQRYADKIEDEQEILAGITDVAMNAFAIESVRVRAEKSCSALAADYADVFIAGAMETIELAARTVLAACAEGDALRIQLAILKRFARMEPVDTIHRRRKIAGLLTGAGRYLV